MLLSIAALGVCGLNVFFMILGFVNGAVKGSTLLHLIIKFNLLRILAINNNQSQIIWNIIKVLSNPFKAGPAIAVWAIELVFTIGKYIWTTLDLIFMNSYWHGFCVGFNKTNIHTIWCIYITKIMASYKFNFTNIINSALAIMSLIMTCLMSCCLWNSAPVDESNPTSAWRKMTY